MSSKKVVFPDLGRNPQDVVESLLAPLAGRAVASQKYPEILQDPKSVEIYNSLPPSLIPKFNIDDEFFGLQFCVRARVFDSYLLDFLKAHPGSSVVNLGAGLDTVSERHPRLPGKIYHVDLPDTIYLRQYYLEENDSSINVTGNVFELDWVDEIPGSEEAPTLFLAAGLFMYYPRPVVLHLLHQLPEYFPQGEVLFDVPSPLALGVFNHWIKPDARYRWYFSVRNAKDLAGSLSPPLKVDECRGIWEGIRVNPAWNWKTKVLVKYSHWVKPGKLVRIGW